MVGARNPVGEIEIHNRSDRRDGEHDERPNEPGFVDLTDQEIGRYRIQKRLGRGGITTVYQAYDMVDDFPVALKVLLHNTDAKLYNRFRFEAQTAAKLRHPHIIRTLRVGITPSSESAYIAMELVEGEDLSALLAARRRLSPEESCVLLEPIARALAYAHSQSVIHRDVKPSNILLRAVGAGVQNSVVLESLDYPIVPLLSDFGIARALDVPDLTNVGRTIGTPAYMAPEQCRGQRDIDHRADLYALGAVFYRCITGRQPFVGSTVQILHAHVYDPIVIDEEVLRQLSQQHIQILQRSLAKEPNERYQSAEEMAADLVLGADATALHLTDEQRESSATMTLNLLPVSTVSTASQTAILVVNNSGSATVSEATAQASHDLQPIATEGHINVYYDREMDHRLRKWSGIVLTTLLTIITVVALLSLMGFSLNSLIMWVGKWLSATPAVVAQDLAQTDPPLGPALGGGNQLWRKLPDSTVAPRLSLSVAQTTTSSVAAPTPSLPGALQSSRETQQAVSSPQLSLVDLLLGFVVGDSSQPECDPIDEALLKFINTQLDVVQATDFQCAEATVEGEGEFLTLRRGFMLYLPPIEKLFIYSETDQQWEDVKLSWHPDEIAPTIALTMTLTPDDGLFVPGRMFAFIWQDPAYQLLLGAATMPESLRFPAVAQKFPGGWLIYDRSSAEYYLFLKERRRL
ncbi:MAG: serine/threonine-protein kinase [Caldilineaceae bacterium]